MVRCEFSVGVYTKYMKIKDVQSHGPYGDPNIYVRIYSTYEVMGWSDGFINKHETRRLMHNVRESGRKNAKCATHGLRQESFDLI